MEFLVTLEEPNTEQSRQLVQTFYTELKTVGLPVDKPELRKPQSKMITRGDPVTLAAVAAIAVGAGGALTVALSKDGFLTQLARVLEKYVERSVQVEITDKAGNPVRIKGSAADVRKILNEHCQ
jgi:hypothetical protein